MSLGSLRKAFKHWAFRAFVLPPVGGRSVVALWARHPDETVVAVISDDVPEGLQELNRLLNECERGDL